MKANKLMIGDWVNSPNGYFRIKLIDSEWSKDMEERITPIPLTPEILEKNGWWQDEIDGTYHNTMNVYGRKAPFSIFDGVAINYVHDLQHALRLCGLNELADNFIV